jgi:hypothetical protein
MSASASRRDNNDLSLARSAWGKRLVSGVSLTTDNLTLPRTVPYGMAHLGWRCLTLRERARAYCRIGFQPVFPSPCPRRTTVAGGALPDRKQAGSLFYIGLRRVERWLERPRHFLPGYNRTVPPGQAVASVGCQCQLQKVDCPSIGSSDFPAS